MLFVELTGRVNENESILLALRERMGELLPECRGGGSSQCILTRKLIQGASKVKFTVGSNLLS